MMIKGQGSYGIVKSVGGKAVKTFKKIPHLIQECLAAKYLDDSRWTVKVHRYDLQEKSITMDLYDMSLREWLDKRTPNGRDNEKDKKMLLLIYRDILFALNDLHDRGLAHADLKPSNILVNIGVEGRVIKLVLGDLGFVAPSHVSKTERTAAVYRELNVEHDRMHDLYSLAIITIELFGNIRFIAQGDYNDVRQAVKEGIICPYIRRIAMRLCSPNRQSRPSCRNILKELFDLNVPAYNIPNTIPPYNRSVTEEWESKIREWMVSASKSYGFRRAKIGFVALFSFLNRNNVPFTYFPTYYAIMLMILSAVYGPHGFDISDVGGVISSLGEHTTEISILENLHTMMEDDELIRIIFLPPSKEFSSSSS